MSAKLTELNIAYRQALIDRRPAAARVHHITAARGRTFSGFYWLLDTEGRRHLARCGPNVEQAFVTAGQGVVDAYKAVLARKHGVRAEIKAELVRVALEKCTRVGILGICEEIVQCDARVWDANPCVRQVHAEHAARSFAAQVQRNVSGPHVKRTKFVKQAEQARARFAHFLWDYFQALRGHGQHSVGYFKSIPSALTAELAPAADEPIGRLPEDNDAGGPCGPCGGAVGGGLRAVREARSPAAVTLQLDVEETTR